MFLKRRNNVPNTNKLLGRSYLPSASINTSNNGTTETIFALEYPLYLVDKTDYCFIVHPEGNSPEYNVWVGETGGFDVATNEQVYSNPYAGLMFVSANFKTWSAIQKEDIKFNQIIFDATLDPLNEYIEVVRILNLFAKHKSIKCFLALSQFDLQPHTQFYLDRFHCSLLDNRIDLSCNHFLIFHN